MFMVLYYKSKSKLLLVDSKFDEEKEEKKNEALATFDIICLDNSEKSNLNSYIKPYAGR